MRHKLYNDLEDSYIQLAIQSEKVMRILDEDFQSQFSDLSEMLDVSVQLLKMTTLEPFNVLMTNEYYGILPKRPKLNKKNKRQFFRKWKIEYFDVDALSEKVPVEIGLYLVELHRYFDLLRVYFDLN